MEDFQTYCKPAYKCGICGNIYDSVYERMTCESECHKKQEEEIKATEKMKKKAEQAARKSEVDSAVENLHRLITEYVKDYGHYEYDNDEDNSDFYWPSRIWHYFV